MTHTTSSYDLVAQILYVAICRVTPKERFLLKNPVVQILWTMRADLLDDIRGWDVDNA